MARNSCFVDGNVDVHMNVSEVSQCHTSVAFYSVLTVFAYTCRELGWVEPAPKGRMAMECRRTANLIECSCTYEPCPRKGDCCACIKYHRASNEIPGCLFPPAAERTYDRSMRAFLAAHSSRGNR